MLPYLQGDRADSPHEYLFWRFGDQMAVRKKEWKITRAALQQGPQTSPGQGLRKSGARLYNLARDIGEAHDVAAEHPNVVKDLVDAWERWNSEMIAPRWQPSLPPARPTSVGR